MPDDDAIAQAKQAIREKVWALLEREGAVRSSPYGKIPDFIGSEEAAARLAELDIWKRAQVIVANPDRAQLPVRVRALQDGKLLYMAVPRLAREKPFYLLDPLTLDQAGYELAVTGTGAFEVAPLVHPVEMQPVDLVVCGSVAVNRLGVRLGKGAGFSDVEVALLEQTALIGIHTAITTTVHDCQFLKGDIPSLPSDHHVDAVVTPHHVLQVPSDNST